MIKKVFLVLPLLLVFVLASATAQTSSRGFKVREPNLYAPYLYTETLDFKAMLLDLPGARDKHSYWELSYQLYFVPEDKYYEALKRAPKGPSNPTPQEFPGRVLLAKDYKKRLGVGTIAQRTISRSGVPFKNKVRDSQRTKFAHLLTAYSIKIFDAHLKTTVYYSGIFLTEPFQEGTSEKKAIARKTIYLSFSVNSDGSLNRSQLPPRTNFAP